MNIKSILFLISALLLTSCGTVSKKNYTLDVSELIVDKERLDESQIQVTGKIISSDGIFQIISLNNVVANVDIWYEFEFENKGHLNNKCAIVLGKFKAYDEDFIGTGYLLSKHGLLEITSVKDIQEVSCSNI